MTQKNLLRILFVEDLPSDADLEVLELRKEGLRFEHMRVDTRDELIKALKEFKPDIVISDYMMPSYNGMQALKDAHELDPLVPFILCTGSMNEETAVECLKAGANDYIIKEHLTRLPFAVKEVLEQHRIQIEKRASELLLKENEAKLQSIFSAAPIGIGLLVGRVFVEVNDTFCTMTGYNRKELLGKNAEALYEKDEQNESAGIVIYRHIAERGTGSTETRFKRKDGRILNILLSSIPLDQDDLKKGVTFTALDITDRKQTEDIINRERIMLRTLIDNIPDMIYVKDMQGRKVTANIADVNNIGYSTEDDVLGKTDIELFPGHIGLRGYNDDQEVINSGKPIINREEYFFNKAGERRWLLTSKLPLLNNTGKTTGLVGIGRDITMRKLVEEELKRNQAQLLNAHMIAQLGSWEYNVENDLFTFNDPFYSIFRTTAEQIGGYTMKSADYARRFVHPEDIALVGLETRKAIETDDPDFSRQLEHRIIYADGETGYITVRFFIVKDESGKTVRTYGVNQDITARKRVEVDLSKAAEQMKLAKEKAEANDKLKTTFLNNISHEVRTPLNGILGFAEIMSQTELSEEEKQVSLSMLFESSDRLLSTITNYMDISMITSGNLVVSRRDFDPGQVLKELYGKYKRLSSGRNLELVLKLPEHSGKFSLKSDPELLNKIISHLLGNAIKFTGKGSILYGFVIRDNDFEFFVKDTGIGIGQESLNSMFERFAKEDYGPAKITEGSGLGLSISKGMVELLGGKIWVESETGKGSAFFFTIPIIKENSIYHPVARADVPRKNKIIKSILVAEDDEVNFFYINSILKKNTSAVIIHASNGQEAIDKFKGNPDISLILMDIKMPLKDGLTATQEIKAIKRDVPVIAVTAYATTGDEHKALEAGCNGYLSKPITGKQLLEKIAEFIEL